MYTLWGWSISEQRGGERVRSYDGSDAELEIAAFYGKPTGAHSACSRQETSAKN